MSKKYGTLSQILLELIGEGTGFFTWPIEGTNDWRLKQMGLYGNKKIYNNLYYLRKKGLVKEISKKGKRFIELTQKGQMEKLFAKAHIKTISQEPWDGKWRLMVFDIPEDAKDKREKLRRLLRENGFKFLQASVFISPYSLHREALEYLKQSGLIQYIRIARIDELDDDKDLKKKFKLK